MEGPDRGKSMERTDQELMTSFQNGDAASFDELLRRYQGPLFTYIYKILRDRGEAEPDFFNSTSTEIRHSG